MRDPGASVASPSQCLAFAVGYGVFAALFAVFAGVSIQGSGGSLAAAIWLGFALISVVMAGRWRQRWLDRRGKARP